MTLGDLTGLYGAAGVASAGFVYRAAPLAVALQHAPLFAALAGPFAQAS